MVARGDETGVVNDTFDLISGLHEVMASANENPERTQSSMKNHNPEVNASTRGTYKHST